MVYLAPLIERRLGWEQSIWRRQTISTFSRAFSSDFATLDNRFRDKFYVACTDLLKRSAFRRLVLYLPFLILKDAPEFFCSAYLAAWQALLYSYDVREDFHLGMVSHYEQKLGGTPQVTKAAHLLPWLLEYGLLDSNDLFQLVAKHKNNPVTLRSFHDTTDYLLETGLLSAGGVESLADWIDGYSGSNRRNPFYLSRDRERYLTQLTRPVELLTPDADLAQSPDDYEPVLEVLTEQGIIPARDEILLITGAPLKGYGANDGSDLMFWNLEELKSSSDSRPGIADLIHIYLCSLWVGGDAVKQKELKRQTDAVLSIYHEKAGSRYRIDYEFIRVALGCLEHDTLQADLLYQGYARMNPDWHPLPSTTMDGDCPFYDDGYRKLASLLFLKYVWL